MKPFYELNSKEWRGIMTKPNTVKPATGSEREMKMREWNYVTKSSARRRYLLISRANALGGWIQKTMRKRWMQKWWRRRKKKRLRHSKPVEPMSETSSGKGFDLIRGQDRAEERVSQSLLHIIPTTRTLRQAIPRVTPATRTGIKLTALSDSLSVYSAGDIIFRACIGGGTDNAEDNHVRLQNKTFKNFQETHLVESGEQIPPTSLCTVGHNIDKSNKSKGTSNPFDRLTESRSVHHTHAIITVNTCVSYQNCCCDRYRAPGAKRSGPNVYLQKQYCLPTSPNKDERIRKLKQLVTEQGSCHPSVIKSVPVSKVCRFTVNSQSGGPLFQVPTRKSRSCRHPSSLSWWWAYFTLALLCNSSSLPLLRAFCLVEAAPSSSSFAPKSLHLMPYSSSPSFSSSPSARLASPSRPARYQLISPKQTNESITIYLSPPSIKNLRVNTQRKVSFNFTVQRQGSASPSAPFLDTTSTSESSAKANDAGKHHVEAAVNDAASDYDRNQQLSPTTATVNTFNNSTSNSRVHVSAQESGKNSFSNEGKEIPLIPQPASSPKRRKPGVNKEQYRVMIYSDNDIIARPLISSREGLASVRKDARGSYILMDVTAGQTHNFSVEALHIGRVTVSVAVVDASLDMHLESEVQAVAATQYPVSAVRGERTADLVFNISATVIAIIISFGIGAVTDTDNIKRQIKHPVSLIIGFCCQFILMPLMAFGLAMLLPLHSYKDIRFGLLCVACVPGGGLGHVAVVIADGDVSLSLTLNFISAIAMLGTAPLWIFVLGQYFQGDPENLFSSHSVPVLNFEIWLVASFLAYMAGLLIKRLRPVVADAILMWLIKPFLLLASILYITLGVYINMYVFELVNEYALLGAMLLPFSGCLVGGLAAFAFRQPYTFIKTIALETSSLNCLVVMVALRYSLEQPDADLAAMIPIWVMFTIPGLFVSLAICNKIKNVIRHYWDNRNGNKKESEGCSASKAYSVSSSVVSPPGTTTLSAPLVVADGGLDDDLTVSTMSNQKVTVL